MTKDPTTPQILYNFTLRSLHKLIYHPGQHYIYVKKPTQ